jgi:hypothetical protein
MPEWQVYRVPLLWLCGVVCQRLIIIGTDQDAEMCGALNGSLTIAGGDECPEQHGERSRTSSNSVEAICRPAR